MFLLLFVQRALSYSLIPDEYKELRSQALENSHVKVPKEEREDTMLPGFYEGENYHFQLKKPLTCSNTKDIKGFALKDNRIAIVKRKNFKLDDGFIFIEPETQKLYKLKKTVAADEKVQIYDIKETSIFNIMTNFKVHTKVRRSNAFRSFNESIKDPLQNVKQDFNFHWNEKKSEPMLEKIQNTNLLFGYGAYASIEADLEYAFNSLRDVKLEAQLFIDSYIGAKFEIPDGFQHTFYTEWFKPLSLTIPNLGFKKTFLKKYELAIGVFANLQATMESLVLDVPIGFQYFKGLRFYGNKNILITPSQTLDSPWKYNFLQLGEDNSGSLEALKKTIKSATLTANFPIHLYLSFNLTLGDIKTSLSSGINFPFHIVVGIDDDKCSFPFLTIKLVFPIQMTLTLNEFMFLKFNIWKKHSTILDISAEFTIGPKCLAPNLAQLYYDKIEPENPTETDEPKTPINPVHENVPSTKDHPKVPVLEEKIVGNEMNANLYFEEHETCGLWRLIIPSKFKDSYALISTKNFILSIDGATILNEHNNLIKITGTVLEIFVTRIRGIKYHTVDVYLCNLCVGHLDPVVYLSEMNIKPGLFNIMTAPCIHGTTYVSHECNYCKYANKHILINDDVDMFFYEGSREETGLIVGSYIAVPPEQPYLKHDFGHLSIINLPEGEDPFVTYHVYCDNTKKLLMEYTLNGENVKKIDDKPKDNIFEFDIPIQKSKTFYVTFTPICDDESGIMCQLELEEPKNDGYYILKYPNRDGISITGSGFLVEAIKVKANQPITYYKYSKDRVRILKKYDDSTLKITPKIEDVSDSSSLLESTKRICLYNDEDNFIIPFSRKSSQENIDEFYQKLGIKIETDDDYQKVSSDEDGCITVPAEMLTKSEISLADLPQDAADIKFEKPEDNHNPDPDKKKNGIPMGAIIGIVVGAVVVVAIIVVVAVILVRRKRARDAPSSNSINENENENE